MSMKKIILICVALTIALGAKAYDAKFQKKAAEKVWSTAPEIFDPKIDIPETILAESSAVIIGDYDYINCDFRTFNGHSGNDTKTETVRFTRIMVKLLDKNAIEQYSTHEFGDKAKFGLKYRKALAEAKNAFGARIYKPDGRVVDVDVSKAYDISEGKKSDGKGRKKIDIPGLEVGDVLEYFTYDEIFLEDMNLPPFRVSMVGEYPVLNLVIDGTFAKELTVEYKAYNGAPELQVTRDQKGKNTVYLHKTDIPAMTDKKMVNKTFEYPYYIFYVLNNESPYILRPHTARRGGIYPDIFIGNVYMDIGNMLTRADFGNSTLPGKLKKMIKDYRKKKPEAERKEVTDMAWIAANYLNETDKSGGYSDMGISLIYTDVMRSEHLADSVGVAIITSYDDPDVSEIIHWQQPDYGAYVDGRLYTVNTSDAYLASEVPGMYQGRNAAYFNEDRKKTTITSLPEGFVTPTSKSGDNRIKLSATIKLDDDGNADITADVNFTGAMKTKVSHLNLRRDWIAAQEEWLGIEPGKRFDPPALDKVEYMKELKDASTVLLNDMLYTDAVEVEQLEIKDRGITPGNPNFTAVVTGKLKDMTAKAGNDLIVNVGHLAGKQSRIEGKQRESRLSNIDFGVANQRNYAFEIEIPEGYGVYKESLDALSNQVQNAIGMFVTGAKVSDDGRKVTLMVRTRIQNAMVSPEAWPLVIELTDAASAFNDAQLILEKL